MAATEEEAVRAFMAEWDGEQWDASQIDRMLGHMATDVQYHIYAWEDPLVGRDAIRAEWLRQADMFRDFRSEILIIGSVGQVVFVERVETMTLAGTSVTLHLTDVLEVNRDGKIAAWRSYSDSREVAVKVGEDLAAQDRAV